MFVCSCHAVTDRTVDAVIASGATTVEHITERCGAGGTCAGCWPELERLLEEHQLAKLGIRRRAVA